jgi:glutamate synthase domain-containing protein 1
MPSLIDERFDHDSCGVGFVALIDAVSSHLIPEHALTALARLAHRGAVAADGKSSDGVGLMTAVPRTLLLDYPAGRSFTRRCAQVACSQQFYPDLASPQSSRSTVQPQARCIQQDAPASALRSGTAAPPQ